MAFDMEVVGANLRALRARRQWTQKEAARRAGMNVGSLQSYERGEYSPSYEKAYALADLYGVSLDDLADKEVIHDGLHEQSGS